MDVQLHDTIQTYMTLYQLVHAVQTEANYTNTSIIGMASDFSWPFYSALFPSLSSNSSHLRKHIDKAVGVPLRGMKVE